MLETIFYTVIQIDGDYAHLVRDDNPDMEPKLVAMALLPFNIKEGSRVKYEMMEYSIEED